MSAITCHPKVIPGGCVVIVTWLLLFIGRPCGCEFDSAVSATPIFASRCRFVGAVCLVNFIWHACKNMEETNVVWAAVTRFMQQRQNIFLPCVGFRICLTRCSVSIFLSNTVAVGDAIALRACFLTRAHRSWTTTFSTTSSTYGEWTPLIARGFCLSFTANTSLPVTLPVGTMNAFTTNLKWKKSKTCEVCRNRIVC